MRDNLSKFYCTSFPVFDLIVSVLNENAMLKIFNIEFTNKQDGRCKIDDCIINCDDIHDLKLLMSLAKNTYLQFEQYQNQPNFSFSLPIFVSGTEYAMRIWRYLTLIPYGSLVSYGELAKLSNSAPLAVGTACGSNPLPIIIPCHRVIKSNGKIGGFMGSEQDNTTAIKAWLISMERKNSAK